MAKPIINLQQPIRASQAKVLLRKHQNASLLLINFIIKYLCTNKKK